MSHKVVDGSTAFHFGVGAFAGWFGMDPKVVLLTALVADATWEVLKAGSVGAAFEPVHAESKAKEILNLLSIMAGAHAGKYAKEHREAAAAPPATAPAPSATESPTVSGLGLGVAPLVDCTRRGASFRP